MKSFLEKWATIFFISAGIFVSILLVEAVVLAFFSQFRAPFIYLSLIPAFATAMLFSILLKRDVKSLPKITMPVLFLILLISFILIFYPHDTFGGRDEAGYTNIAVHLTKTFSLIIPAYLDNLPGLPAENYRTLPPAYPIWLGFVRSFFGDQGLLRGNVITIILGVCSFFLVSSYLEGKKIGLIATILFSSCMPFLWFSRETMSENLSFFLLWSLILFLFFFLKTKRVIYLIVSFICSWLFGLTRFEGFLLQFVLLFVLPPLLFINKIRFKKNLVLFIIYILVLISNIYIAKDIFVSPFLKDVLPKVARSIKNDASSLVPKNLSIKDNVYSISGTSNRNLNSTFPFFTFLMMAKYNFILVIFSIFIITAQFFIRFKKLDKSKKFFFIILILLLPEYYKLFSPNITIDQPWLYRRYMYALLPFGYLCLSLLLSQLKHKKLLITILITFFIINIYLSKNILFLKNNWLLIDKIEKVTENISTNDLVIIRVTNQKPLEYYHLNSYLLFNKGVRMINSYQLEDYPFDPKNKIFNNVSYEKIYLLSIENQERFPFFTTINRETIKTDYLQLVPSCQLYLLGEEEGLANPYNIGLLPFSSVEKYCSKTKNEIIKHKENIYLYELVYKNE